MSLHEDLGGRLTRALTACLPSFLPQCRWFGGKARGIAAADIEDAAWLPSAGPPCAIVVVDVRFVDGGSNRYLMVLAFVSDPAGLPVVGCVEEAGGATWIVEATSDGDAALALLRGFSSSASLVTVPMLHGGALEYGDAEAAVSRSLARCQRADVRPVGAEQSNTSLRLDRSLAFKLFRRLEEGENPELEVGRFLATRTTFRAMPVLRGSITYVPARGEPATVGVLQDWIESHGDGWTYVVARLGETHGARRILPDLYSLGATTCDFHVALAGDATVPAFAPEPTTPADVQAWRTSLLERTSRTFRLIERSMRQWPEDARQQAQAVLTRQDRIAALVPEFHLNADDVRFLKIRTHGDYHLGQTLKTDDGFVLIDFEGEPARPLDERRLKQCALKDLAGMLRSFDYAIETARTGGAAALTAADVDHLRRAFLDGYLSSAPPQRAAFLPVDRSAIAAWLAYFEAERALYEMEYEINNRPEWVRIPLGGILDILGERPERSHGDAETRDRP